jgi:hypothetical protein
MNIHQVSVTYLPEQDRFLARISTREGEEMRLWLTRRLLLPLMPVLTKIAAEQLVRQTDKIDPAAPPEVQRQRMVENFKKEALAHAGDFKTPYQAKDAALPLGKEPLLVTEIKMSLLASGKLQLNMVEKLPGQARNVQIAINTQLTQGLLRLLNQGLKKSQWLKPPAQAASLEAAVDAAEPGEEAPKPRYLN